MQERLRRRIGGVCGHPAPAPATFCKACWSAAPVATDCLYKHLGYKNKSILYYTCPRVYVSELTHRRVCSQWGGKRTEVPWRQPFWADVSALLSEPQRLKRQEFQRRQQSSQAPGPEVNQSACRETRPQGSP